ncbi:MAG: Calx-beta domain-containing protein, partial [Alphaproteobacteria bacterium]|nr:Calx-beta domain-containing protein [Alphaproteobacteria bacterium]
MSLSREPAAEAVRQGSIVKESGSAGGPIVLEAASGESLLVPGGRFLLTAEYARQGDDLVLTGKDGQVVLIRDFFALEEPPVLVNETGMQVLPELAARLAGPENPGVYAQAAPAGAGNPIGQVSQLKGEATATRADGTQVTLAKGDPVFEGDVIETGGDSVVAVVFVDDTRFNMSENARMTLDRLVYNPAGGENDLGVSLLQGAFTFVSGQIAKTGPDVMTIETPVGTLGIRGTDGGVNIQVGADVTIFISDGAGLLRTDVGEALLVEGTGLILLSRRDDPSLVVQQFSIGQMRDFVGDLYLAVPGLGGSRDGDVTGGTDPDAGDLPGVDPEAGPQDGDGDGDADQDQQGDATGTVPVTADPQTALAEPEPLAAAEPQEQDTTTTTTTGGDTGDAGGAGRSTSADNQDPVIAVITETGGELPEDTLAAITGTDEPDDLTGTAGPDTIDGLAGDDTIQGAEGDDSLTGSGGNDQIAGNAGNDALFGSANDDSLSGGAGNDTMGGNTGNDLLDGGPDSDTAVFDVGIDNVVSADITNSVEIETESEGTDTLVDVEFVEFNGITFALVEGTNEGGDALSGGDGRDFIVGGDGNDSLSGLGDGDALFGGAGGDTLDGGSGNDLLNGGTGNDDIVGGEGSDTAVFAGNLADYSFDVRDGTLIVSGADGTDNVTGVEFLQFDDQTIAADVSTVSIAVLDPGQASEDSGSITYRVSLDGPAAAPVTVAFSTSGAATEGTDYNALPDTVTIPQGASFVDIVVTPVADGTFEGDEDVVLTLDEVTSGPATIDGENDTATGTIIDVDEAPILAIAPANAVQAEGDEGPTAFTFTVTRTGDLSGETTVDFA